MNPVSKFHTSLFILNECHEKIERLYFQFKNHPESGPTYYLEPHLIDLAHYLILETASFLDEYQIYFVQTKKISKRVSPIEFNYVQRIKDIHLVIKPVLAAINRWKDIEDYRDSYVAHTNRSGWQSTLKIASQEGYDAPRQFWEFQLLRDLIHIMFGIISQEFKMELIDADFFARSRKSVVNPRKDNSRIEDELKSMIDECQQKCKQQEKEFTLNVSPVDYPQLKQMVDKMTEFNHPLLYTHSLIRNNHKGIVSKIKNEIKQEMKKKEPNKIP